MKKFTPAMLFVLFTMFCNLYAKADYNNNYSASFNGTNAYLKMPQTDGDMQLHDPFTIEFWIKPKAYPAAGASAIILQKADPASGNGIYISLDDQGRVGVSINNFYYTTPAPAMINFWTHIAVVYGNGNLKLYFNSSEVVTQALSAGDVYQVVPAYIGAMATQTGTMINFYNGELDELRIWGVVRAYYDIENYCHQSYTGMGAAYSALRVSLPMNNDFTDQGGKEFNTLTNHKVKFTDYTNQNADYLAYNSSLSDNNSVLVVPDHNDLDATSGVTVEYWGRFASEGVYVYKGDPGSMNYFLAYTYNSTYGFFLRFFYTSGSDIRLVDKIIPAPVLPSPGGWNHIAATYKASSGNLRLYVNSVMLLDTVIVAGEMLEANDKQLTMQSANGRFDEIRIWKNTVRTPAQIKADMFKAYNYTMNPLPSNVTVYDFDGRMDDVMKPIADSAKTLRLAGGPVYYKTFDHFPKASDLRADRNTAPLIRDDKNYFGDNTKYTMSTKRLIASLFYNKPQTITDSVFVSQNGTLVDLKVCVFADIDAIGSTLNDGVSQAIKLTLVSPSGKQVQLTPELNSTYIGNTLYCVFDMNALSKIDYNNYFGVVLPPFSPEIQPYQSLTKFNNKSMHGWWKLRFDIPAIPSFNDVELFGWGLYPIAASSANETLAPENLAASQDKINVEASAFPNPFFQSVNISYALAEKSDIHISVTDASGRTVAVLLNKKDDEEGIHQLSFDGSELTAGIYFCRVTVGNKTQTIKIVKQ